MEAKDTVIKLTVSGDNESLVVAMAGILEQQAEISFKAGVKEVMDLWEGSPRYYPEHEENGTGYCNYGCTACLMDKKLEEWGIE